MQLARHSAVRLNGYCLRHYISSSSVNVRDSVFSSYWNEMKDKSKLFSSDYFRNNLKILMSLQQGIMWLVFFKEFGGLSYR